METRIAALARENTALRAERDKLTLDQEALRAQFAAFADKTQELQVGIETKSLGIDWGHMRYRLLAMLATLSATARKMAQGQPAYVPTYRQRAIDAEAKLAALEEALTALEANLAFHDKHSGKYGTGCELHVRGRLIKEQEHLCGLTGYGALGDTCPACHGPFTYRQPRCTCDFGKAIAALRASLVKPRRRLE